MVSKKVCMQVDEEKEFITLFEQLCRSRIDWQVWSDLMSVFACSISNSLDHAPEHFEAREKEYEDCIQRLGSVEIAAKLFSMVVLVLERDPEQDFLGNLYMRLKLGNHWKGQFFTPYNVSKMMAEMMIGDPLDELKDKEFISICDPTCGAGSMLIAAANCLKSKLECWQNLVLFVGQDIDRVVGLMCYVQLSLLGCVGYVLIGDSLLNPLTDSELFPKESDNTRLWYTPIFLSEVWTVRRFFHHCSMEVQSAAQLE